MPPELAQWIPPAVIVAILLYLHRSIRSEFREAAKERGELRERMAHLEGLLEGLREAITRRNVA